MMVRINDRWVDDDAASTVITQYYDTIERLKAEILQLNLEFNDWKQKAIHLDGMYKREREISDQRGNEIDRLTSMLVYEFNGDEIPMFSNTPHESSGIVTPERCKWFVDEIEKLKEFISLAFEAHPNLDIDIERLNK